MTQEALKLALVALEEWYFGCGAGSESHDDAVEAIKQALAAQPVPVKTYHDGKPWPVAPKPWVGLTDEEENEYNYLGPDMHWVIQEIAAKLKEKNT
jgi:hypothetical protein